MSLSSAYPNRTRTFGVEEPATVIGIPIGPPSHRPEPKSGWSEPLRPIDRTIVREFLCDRQVVDALVPDVRLREDRAGRRSRQRVGRDAAGDGERQGRSEEKCGEAAHPVSVGARSGPLDPSVVGG